MGVEPVVVVEVVAAENTCAHNRARVVVVAVALLDVLHYLVSSMMTSSRRVVVEVVPGMTVAMVSVEVAVVAVDCLAVYSTSHSPLALYYVSVVGAEVRH